MTDLDTLTCSGCRVPLALLADPASGVDHDDACVHWADVSDLRRTASDWHGGQASPLYAFSSTGTVTIGIVREIRRCWSLIFIDQDAIDLHDLLAYVEPIESALIAADETDHA